MQAHFARRLAPSLLSLVRGTSLARRCHRLNAGGVALKMASSDPVGEGARSYWIPGSYAPTLSENRSTFLRPLKNNGLKEERVTKVGVDDLDNSTTLESNPTTPLYLAL
jgi:hypothetical protein